MRSLEDDFETKIHQKLPSGLLYKSLPSPIYICSFRVFSEMRDGEIDCTYHAEDVVTVKAGSGLVPADCSIPEGS